MNGFDFILNPWCQILLKLMLFIGLLLLLKRMHFSAAYQASIWRVAMCVLLVVPVFSLQKVGLEIPILMDTEVGQTPIQPLPQPTDPAINDEVATVTYVDAMQVFWLLMAAVSMTLLCKLGIQLRRLKLISQQASSVDDDDSTQILQRCQRQMALHQLPMVKTSSAVKSPYTWGWLNPVIMLPSNMRSEALPVVLLHEMAHIKRRDWLWLMVAQMATALFWFNPFLWWAKHHMVNCFEAACDELVLDHPIRPSQYAETILGFHSSQPMAWGQVTTMMAQPSALYQRLNRILNPQYRRHSMQKNKQNLLLISAGLTTALIAVSQLTIAHDGLHPEPPTTPAAVPHLASPATPPTSKPALPHPPHAAALATPASPHTDGEVVPAPPAAPVIHNSEHVHEGQHAAVSQVAQRVNQQAHELRVQAEQKLHQQQAVLRELTQQRAEGQHHVKQQLAKLERQRKELMAEQERREAKLTAMIERERMVVKEEMEKLELAQAKLKQEAKRLAEQND